MASSSSKINLLPLDCLSIILSYGTIKEAISVQSRISSSFLAASRLEATWDSLFQACGLDAFFALQMSLAEGVADGRMREEAIEAVGELRVFLDQETRAALLEARQPDRKRASLNGNEDVYDDGTVPKMGGSGNRPQNNFSGSLNAPPGSLAQLRSQTFLFLLDLIGAPDLVKVSDYVKITTLCCQFVHHLNTGELEKGPRETAFATAPPSVHLIPGNSPGSKRALTLEEQAFIRRNNSSGTEGYATEMEISQGVQRRSKRCRSQSPQETMSCDDKRRQLLAMTRATLRPGILCDPLSKKFQCQDRLFDLNLPGELLVLYSCIGGQDFEVISRLNQYGERGTAEPRDLAANSDNIISGNSYAASTTTTTAGGRRRRQEDDEEDDLPNIPYVDTMSHHLKDSIGNPVQRAHYSGLFGSVHYYDKHMNRFFMLPQNSIQAFQHQINEMATMMEPLRKARAASQRSSPQQHGALDPFSGNSFSFDSGSSGTRTPGGSTTLNLVPDHPLAAQVEGFSPMEPVHHFPMDRVFPFATTEAGSRIGIVLQDIILAATANVDLAESGQEGFEGSESDADTDDMVTPRGSLSNSGRPSGGLSSKNHVYRRGSILMYVVSRNPNNAFVLAPSLTHFLEDLVHGTIGNPEFFQFNAEQQAYRQRQLQVVRDPTMILGGIGSPTFGLGGVTSRSTSRPTSASSNNNFSGGQQRQMDAREAIRAVGGDDAIFLRNPPPGVNPGADHRPHMHEPVILQSTNNGMHHITALGDVCSPFAPPRSISGSSLGAGSEYQDTNAPQQQQQQQKGTGSAHNPGKFLQRYEPHPLYGGILRNPMFSRNSSYAVTHGVEVVVSPAFLADQSRKNVRYCYTYQVSMRFLYPTARNPGPTCQLIRRRWAVRHFRRADNANHTPQGVGPFLRPSGPGLFGGDPTISRGNAKPHPSLQHRSVFDTTADAVGGGAFPPVTSVLEQTDEVEGPGVVGEYPLLNALSPIRPPFAALLEEQQHQQQPKYHSSSERSASTPRSDFEDNDHQSNNALLYRGGHDDDLGGGEGEEMWSDEHPPPTNAVPVDRFQYSSCTEYRHPYGEMAGELTFVPGTIESPTGPRFSVKIAPFACEYREDQLKDPNSVIWGLSTPQ